MIKHGDAMRHSPWFVGPKSSTPIVNGSISVLKHAWELYITLYTLENVASIEEPWETL